MSSIAVQLATLQHDAIVEMLEIDTSNLGGGLYYFIGQTNQLKGSVVWQGTTYTPFPIEVEGFDVKSDGPLPRPTLKVSNVMGLIGTLCAQYDGLKGAQVTRRRTLAKYLDAVNFTGGVNPTADPNTHYPDEIWFVDRKASQAKDVVVFELVSPLDVGGAMLPRRQVIANVCIWVYREADCGYTGGPCAQEDDTPTTDPALDACGKRLSSCRLRTWPGNELPFGGFPGAGLVQQL